MFYWHPTRLESSLFLKQNGGFRLKIDNPKSFLLHEVGIFIQMFVKVNKTLFLQSKAEKLVVRSKGVNFINT